MSDLHNPLVRLEKANQRIERLRALLEMARCPNLACVMGIVPHGPDPDGGWEAEQCQWCFERDELVKGEEDV